MSISGVSSSSTYSPDYSPSSPSDGTSDDPMQTLIDSLDNGDLSSAMAAYEALLQEAQANGTTSAAGANTNNANDSTAGGSTASSLQQDLAALGQALQSGDLQDAQQALAKLQQDAKAAEVAGQQDMQQDQVKHGGHHHHGHQLEDSDCATRTGGSSSFDSSSLLASWSANDSSKRTNSPGLSGHTLV